MSDQPLVSIVMPVHNAEAVVADAVDSILEQTLKDFEFIIVDDGSSDDSGKILRKYAEQDKRIKLYFQPQSGLIASLNKHCRLARANYIARMDADDISLPTRLEKQLRFLETHPAIGVLGTWIRDVDHHRKPIIEWPVPADPSVVRWFLFFGNCIAHSSVMMRRDLLERLGYYRPEAIYVEDYDLWIRAAEVTGVANIPEVLVEYRVSEGSVSARNLEVQERNAYKLRRELTGRFVSGGDIPSLHRAYVFKIQPSRKGRAEIALDVIRRTGIGFRFVRFLPDLFTLHTLKMVFSMGIWFVKHRGRVSERKR
jgi:glycosyltransferase involved in cell wall biosynthesis